MKTRRDAGGTPLWPFLLVATLIVATAGAVLFAQRRAALDLRVAAKVSGTPTPTAERPGGDGGPRRDGGFLASGSWTMSSLPACFFEQDHQFGSVIELHAKFPPQADRVAPGTDLRSGDCTIDVRPRDLIIRRGEDRLRVPPDARLYRRGDRLTLVFVDGRHAEIRHYCRGFDAVRCPTQSFAPLRRMRI